MDETADALAYQKEIDDLFCEAQPDLDDVIHYFLCFWSVTLLL